MNTKTTIPADPRACLRRSFSSLALPLLACISFFAPADSWAQSTWVGATSADWSDASNWNPYGVPSGVDAVVNTSSGNLATVSSDLSSQQVNLLAIGNSVAGTMNVQAGNLTVNGETWLGNTSSGNGILNMSGGDLSANNWFAIGRGSGHGVLNMTGGTIAKHGNGQLAIGIDRGSVGVLNQSGGSIVIDQNLWIGQSVGSSGEFNLSGTGSVAVYDWIAIGREGGTGVLNISGGLFAKLGGGNLILGADNSASLGVINQTGGEVNNLDSFTMVGSYGAGIGIWNMNGGSAVLTRLHICETKDVIGTFNLNTNGTLITGEITTGNTGANSTLNFNGGRLVASESNENFLHDLATVNVRNGGMIIDDGGFTIGIAQSLAHSAIDGDNAKDGGLTKIGSGTLKLSGANSYRGDTTVSAGTLQFDTAGSVSGAIRLAGGTTLNLNFSGTYVVSGLYVNGNVYPAGTYDSGNLAYITGTGKLKVMSGISTGVWDGGGENNNWDAAGNWDQDSMPIFPIALTFTGNTRTTAINNLNGITAAGITFDAAAGAFVLSGNDITLTGNIGFNGNPAAPITQTINLNMTWNGNRTLNISGNGNLNLGGSLTGVNTLTKIGNGTLTLGSVDTFSSLVVNGGTNRITGGITVNGTDGNFYVGDRSFSSGTLIIEPGAVLTVIGSYNDSAVIGRDSGSGTVIQNGGTFTFNPGNVDHPERDYLFIGATGSSGTRSEYDMNGGLLDMGGKNLAVALSGNNTVITGLVNQVGGAIANVGSLQLGLRGSEGYGSYTMSGGTLSLGTNSNSQIGGITSESGSYAVNLGGGTIGAWADWASPLNMSLTGSNGPVKFDTAGNTISLSGVLSGIGGLTKIGNGTLELTKANTYAGETTVNAGILKLDMPGGSVAPTLRVVTGGMLNLNYSGSYVVGHFYTNGVALPNGTYSAANLGAFITGPGKVVVSTMAFSLDPKSQVAYMNDAGNHSVTLTVATVGAPATYQWYHNGNPVSGATGTNLTLSTLEIGNVGDYYVVATSASGSVTSATATFTVYGRKNRLFAYEGFDYAGSNDASTPIDEGSHMGGSGWNGSWVLVDGNQGFSQVGPTSLAGGTNVPGNYDSRSIGNSLWNYGSSRVGRIFDTSASSELFKQGFIDANGNIGANGKTIYLSFLQQPNTTGIYYELGLKRGSLGDGGRIAGIGNDNGGARNHANFRIGGTFWDLGARDANVADLYVVRIDYKAGNDDVFIYRNPTSITEPVTPTATISNATDMSLYGISVDAFVDAAVNVDEIRLGATWEDAVGLAVSNLLPPTRTANGCKVRFACTPGSSYRIERATNITGPWTEISTVVGSQNAFVEYEDVNAPSGQAFYRTVIR